ncbi:hypothetical protein [Mesonia sp.]|uniref:hypothetical protein n=1 Tax=Mesonia sp. TaxID=1960830 RepID=UPI003F979E48
MKLKKKEIYRPILVVIVVFTAMGFILREFIETGAWFAAIGGAIGFLALYFFSLRK